MRRAVMVASMVGSLMLATGCSKYVEPFKDAPRSRVDNNTPADLVRMPDGFSNIATKCDHGNRVYVVYHGDSPYGSVAVAPNDRSCGGVG